MFLVFDLETTGLDLDKAHVVEWAMAPIDEERLRMPFSGLVRPPIPIPPETSAIHHITDGDVAGMSNWSICSQSIQTIAWRILGHDLLGDRARPQSLVAHNLNLEQHFVGPLFPGVPWICTYRCALRLWPEAPAHNNETLRYWLGLGTRPRHTPGAPQRSARRQSDREYLHEDACPSRRDDRAAARLERRGPGAAALHDRLLPRHGLARRPDRFPPLDRLQGDRHASRRLSLRAARAEPAVQVGGLSHE